MLRTNTGTDARLHVRTTGVQEPRRFLNLLLTGIGSHRVQLFLTQGANKEQEGTGLHAAGLSETTKERTAWIRIQGLSLHSKGEASVEHLGK